MAEGIADINGRPGRIAYIRAMSEATAVRKRLPLLSFVRSGLIVLILFACVTAGIILWQTDPTPTLHHHADGHFSLNSRIGHSVSESEVSACLEQFMLGKIGRMRLVASDATTLSDFGSMINTTAQSGVGEYRLEVGGQAFSFHVPGSGTEEENESDNQKIIDLSGGTQHLDKDDPRFDVVILASPGIRCKELVEAVSKQAGPGKSIAVMAKADASSPPGMWLHLYHSRDGEAEMGEFRSVYPGFIERHIKPRWEALKDWF